MPRIPPALASSFVLIAAVAPAQEPRPLLSRYRGELPCPPALYTAHARLARALVAGRFADIRACCLPGAVRIETRPRKKSPAYGQAINLQFAKAGFSPYILRLRREGSGCMLVNTGTSHLRYVLTAEHGWRLYAYGDKPIR